MHTTHNIHITINATIQPSGIAAIKTSEQIANEYKAAVIAEAIEKGNL